MSTVMPGKATMSEHAKLKIDDQEIDIPITVGTENEQVMANKVLDGGEF